MHDPPQIEDEPVIARREHPHAVRSAVPSFAPPHAKEAAVIAAKGGVMRFGLFGGAAARRGVPAAESARGYHDYVEYHVEAEALGYHGMLRPPSTISRRSARYRPR